MITLSPNDTVLFKDGPAVIPLSRPIITPQDGERLIFGSNASGFHGSGAAGVAMRGTFAHDWRTDEAFLAAHRPATRAGWGPA